MADERTLWQKIKDGAWAAVTAIPRAIFGAAAIMGLPYLLHRATGWKTDVFNVSDAVEGTGEDQKAAIKRLAQRAAIQTGIGVGLSGIMGAVVPPATCPPCQPQGELPRNAGDTKQATGR